MPGRERVEQFALYAVGLALVAFAASFFLGILRPASRQQSPGAGDPSRTPAVEVTPVPRGRIEVLNGSGRSGLARQATERLRSDGFDVVFFGNARSRADSSEVVDRVDRPALARAVAERLGIQRVRSAPDSSLLLDATVVLGRDWPGSQPQAAAPERRGWWAVVRAWLGAD